jgi:hypothetical protein
MCGAKGTITLGLSNNKHNDKGETHTILFTQFGPTMT